MAYKSRINLRIGRTPPVTDDELYPVFQELYNALHLINANLEPIFNELTVPDEGVPATESVVFKSFWVPVASNVQVGRIVRYAGSGMILGATGSSNITQPFGLVLKERNSAGDALVGIPPGALTVDGTTLGEIVYANSSGQFTSNTADWPVGRCVRDGIVMLLPSMAK